MIKPKCDNWKVKKIHICKDCYEKLKKMHDL
jgi:predicted CopG family antitoxin